MSADKETKRYLSLRYKLLIPLMGLGVLMFIMGYFGAQEYLRNTIYEIMKNETDSIREYVEDCLDENQLQALTSGDVEYDEAAGWPAGMTDERYWTQVDCLASVEEFNPRTEIFTYYQKTDSSLAYGVDQYAVLVPEDSYSLGEDVVQDEDYDYLLRGLQNVTYYDELQYFEEDDVYYFAVTSPLRNSQGVIIGGLTIYLDANLAVESLQTLSEYLVLIFIVAFIVVALLVLGITRSVTSELVTLQATSKRVAEGDYAPIALRSHTVNDEVSALGQLFNTMLDKVRQREETLQTKVLKQRAALVRKQRQQKE
ncbi:MAG: HAMP domain-containing protein [Chloroflexi bacterium]|nr:HAMP domain-containing protein [Chloroflexota bacterium]